MGDWAMAVTEGFRFAGKFLDFIQTEDGKRWVADMRANREEFQGWVRDLVACFRTQAVLTRPQPRT